MTAIGAREPRLDAWQEAALARADGPLLVVGGPGSGKTTLVVAAAVSALQRPGGHGAQPLVWTFSRRAASELRNRITRSLGRTTAPPLVMTPHAFARWLLVRFADADSGELRLLTAPEQEFRVRELLLGAGPGRWPEGLTAAHGTRAFARQVRDALARTRQLGLDPEDLVAYGLDARRPEWSAVGHFFDEYLDVLGHEGSLDYAELIHRARILLTDEAVRAELAELIGPVIVDEYPELDPSQIGLLRALVPPGGAVLALGDPDQAVFGFRGAHPRALGDFPATFPTADGSPAPVAVLGGNHRHPPAVAEALAHLVRRLPLPVLGEEAGRVLRPAVGEAGRPVGSRAGWGGAAPAVAVRVCGSEAEQAKLIADTVRAAHLDERLPYGDMAVIVRSGRRQLAPVARALAAAGVPVEVAGDEIPLSAEPAVRPLLLALDLVQREEAGRPDEARRLLTSPLAELDAVSLRALARTLQAEEAAALGESVQVPTGAELMAAGLHDPGRLPGDSQTGEVAALRGLAELVAAARGVMRKPGSTVGDVLWTLWTGTGWPQRLQADSAAGGETGRRADRALDGVTALFEVAAASAQPGGARGIRGFLAEVAAQEIPADTEREAEVRGRGVRLLTAHRAKGRQWPLVVVAGVQEGIWPDLGRQGAALRPDELISDGLVGRPDPRAALAEERRLFHVACSRASRRLLVTAVAGSDGEANQPSRFLDELGVAVRPHTPDERLLTFAALTAELRRTAASLEASPALRRAAVARLAALAMLRDAHDRPVAPQANPERWWGVLEPTGGPLAATGQVRLSATQLTQVLQCPRQYVLARRSHAEPARSSAAGLGSVIHVLAEHARTDGLTADDLLAELDRVWEQIPFDATWMSASEREEAESALARFVNWQEANEHTDVVGVEVGFEVQVDVDGEPVTLTGSVDRLERTAAGLRIVDFKTGRRLPTRAQAQVQEQLGVYQLAADAGAFNEVAGGPTGSAGAVLVYLRQPDSAEDYPKQLHQAALRDTPHPVDDPDAAGYPTWVHHRIARAARIVRQGSYPATPGEGCRWCAFSSSCPAGPGGGQVV